MNQAVQEFLKNSIYERENLNSTLNYKKAALKKFIRFLQQFDDEQFDYNFTRLKRSTYERLPQILFDPDIERIRMLIRNSKQFKLLDKLIICFALNHGAIPNELQQIKFSDVDCGLVRSNDYFDNRWTTKIYIFNRNRYKIPR